jgi:hypothetical protein
MALAIGVKKGSRLSVGDIGLEVLEVQGLKALVRLHPRAGGDIEVDDQERQQLIPQVFVSTAKSRNNDGRTRLVFEAPESIRILREEEHAHSQ